MSLFDIFRPRWRHPNSDIRGSAVQRLDKQSLLEDIAQTDPAWQVRLAAVQRLENQTLLVSIAKSDLDYRVEKAAVARIHAQEDLAEVVRHAEFTTAMESIYYWGHIPFIIFPPSSAFLVTLI